jgi:hypothetical protein
MLELMKKDIKPKDIMSAKAFENAMVLIMATGGSTNAVLHYIAMARSVGRLVVGGWICPGGLRGRVAWRQRGAAAAGPPGSPLTLPFPLPPAVRSAAGIPLTIEDFQRVSDPRISRTLC